MRRISLAIAVMLAAAGAYCVHLYRCRTLEGRSDLILRGRMVELNRDQECVVIQPMEIYKGAVRAGERQRMLVDVVWRWRAPDIMPPWPGFQTNRFAVFFLRKSMWSSSYEPLWIKDDTVFLLHGVLANQQGVTGVVQQAVPSTGSLATNHGITAVEYMTNSVNRLTSLTNVNQAAGVPSEGRSR